ncbi:xanthine dehydrogenase accessory protein XdhC [soil metagenome]
MNWLERAQELSRKSEPFVIATVARVRGHAPRGAGSKMLVTAEEVCGSVGGGNLEQTATQRARALLQGGQASPELLTVPLGPKGGDHGVQCCGGEVTLLLEKVHSQRAQVAVFGAGHVGWALAQVLQLLPIELHLIDSRAACVAPERLDKLSPERAATVRLHNPQIPETVLADRPAGTHFLVLTHDHAEDLAILDMALRRKELGSLGLIGSVSKWAHFKRELAAAGLSDDDLARVTTPIGLPGVPGKSPPAIAIATAAQLLTRLELEDAAFF